MFVYTKLPSLKNRYRGMLYRDSQERLWEWGSRGWSALIPLEQLWLFNDEDWKLA